MFDRNRFEYLTRAAGFTPKQIQKALGLSTSAYYARLQGKVSFSVWEVLTWAEVTGAVDEIPTIWKLA